MESYEKYKKQFQNINIYSLLDEIFKNNRVQQEVIRLNHEQLQSGIDANNKIIHTIGGHPYRAYTVRIKQAKGQPTNVVTLYDTGEFHKTFGVKIISSGYEITANFQKEDGSILDNFTNDFDFLGLTDESLAELVYETILPRLTKLLKQKIGL